MAVLSKEQAAAMTAQLQSASKQLTALSAKKGGAATPAGGGGQTWSGSRPPDGGGTKEQQAYWNIGGQQIRSDSYENALAYTQKHGGGSPSNTDSGGSSTDSGSTPGDKSLKPGDKGDDVKALQQYLVQNGYLTPEHLGMGEGNYGPQTTAAVAKMQKDLGLQPTSGKGYYGPQTQAAIRQKYQTAHDNLKGGEAPGSASAGIGAVQGAVQSQESGDPTFNALAKSFEPIFSALQQTLNNINNPAITGTSLLQEVKKMNDDAGIPQMQTDMMNMQNVMRGTEDDIRNEITKSGGTATDSQVLAMAAARNNVVLKNYNALATNYAAATENVKTMMQYASQDQSVALQKQNMSASVTESMASFSTQLMNMGITMQSHATDSAYKAVGMIGYDGVAAQAQGNPQVLAGYEHALSLAPGALSNPLSLAGLKTMREQQLAQSQQKINVSVNASGGGTGIPSTAIQAQAEYYAATGNVPSFGYGVAGQNNRMAFWNYVANNLGQAGIGDAMGNKASLSAATAALRNQTTQYSAASTALSTLDKQLDLLTQYSDKVDRSGSPAFNRYMLYVKGQYQGDPDTQALQNIVTTASNEFAKILSGSAASIAGTTVSSAAEAKNLINANMTPAQIKTVISVMKQEGTYRLQSQKDTMQQIQTDIKNLSTGGTTYSQGTQDPKTFIENSLSSQGIKYNDVINGAQGKEIPAINSKTGAVVYLLPEEFDPQQYLRL